MNMVLRLDLVLIVLPLESDFDFNFILVFSFFKCCCPLVRITDGSSKDSTQVKFFHLVTMSFILWLFDCFLISIIFFFLKKGVYMYQICTCFKYRE